MRYPIDVKPDGKFFLVTFPDIPEAITQGKSLQEAKKVAGSALETALDFYFENSRVVPKPSRIKRGQDFVELPASVSAKVLLLNEMIRQRVRPAELARRMRDDPTRVNGLTNIPHFIRGRCPLVWDGLGIVSGGWCFRDVKTASTRGRTGRTRLGHGDGCSPMPASRGAAERRGRRFDFARNASSESSRNR